MAPKVPQFVNVDLRNITGNWLFYVMAILATREASNFMPLNDVRSDAIMAAIVDAGGAADFQRVVYFALKGLPAAYAKGPSAARWITHVLRFRQVKKPKPVAPPPPTKPVEVINLDSDEEEDDGPRLKAKPSPPAASSSSAAFSASSHEQERKEEESESSDDMSDEGVRLGALSMMSPVQASAPAAAAVAAASSSSSSNSAAAVSLSAVERVELEAERMVDGNNNDDGGLSGMDMDEAPETAPVPAHAASAPSSPSLASVQHHHEQQQMLLSEVLPEIALDMVDHGPPVVRSPSPPQAVPALPAPLLFDAPAASQPQEEKQAVVEMPAVAVQVPRAAALPSPNSGGKQRASPEMQQAYEEAAQFGADQADEDEKEFREEVRFLTFEETHETLKRCGHVKTLEDTRRFLARRPGVQTRQGVTRPKKDRKKEALGIASGRKKTKRNTLR